jgi:hypothetical protein
MSYDKQELTIHLEYHTPEDLDPNCGFCEMYEESQHIRTKEEMRNLRERFETMGIRFARSFEIIGECGKIIDEACKKNNGLPW